MSGVQDENTRQLMVRLLNLIEDLSADLQDAQTGIQRKVYLEKLLTLPQAWKWFPIKLG